jgi:hypothetical protein
MKILKEKIRAEVKKSGSTVLSTEHPLIKERNLLLEQLAELKDGSNRYGDRSSSSSPKGQKRESPKESTSASKKSQESINSPPLPKEGGGGKPQ